MKDILIKRIFWVGLGLVVLGLMVFHVMVVRSLAAQNEDILRFISDKEKQMKKYADDTDIKNEWWIQAAQKRKMEAEQATQECKEYYEQTLASINKRFLEDPEDPKSGPIKDCARWKEQYYFERAKLQEKLGKAGVQVAKEAFDFREWGNRVPTPEDIDGERVDGVPQPGAQKEFWLQSDVVDCILKTAPGASEEGKAKAERKDKGVRSRVVRLEKIDIQQPATTDTSIALEGAPEEMARKAAQYQLVDATYLVIPFLLTVDVDWKYLPLLIRSLEVAPWPFYVVSLDAQRTPRPEAEKLAAGTGVNASSLVRMTIHAAALDFTPMTIKIVSTAAPGAPGERGRMGKMGRPGGP